jgi:quercetin dioxygenase-like cupin family protein
MHITRSSDAKGYQAAGHHNMTMHRIQGQEVTPLHQVWSARLSMAPGGHVEAKASPAGKLYIVIEGQVKFRGGDTTVELQAGDSVFILPNEEREFSESAGRNALLYLVMLENYQEHI